MIILLLLRRMSPRARHITGWILLGLIAAQGAVGYAQYFTGLPAGLVWVHVCGAVLIWITALLLLFSLRDRGPLAGPGAGSAAGPGTSSAAEPALPADVPLR